MRVVGIALLLVCAVLLHRQMAVWRSSVAVWGHAVAVSPTLPRPALNYGVALAASGDRRGGLLWMVRAGELSKGYRRAAEVRAVIRQQVMVMEAFGDPVCSRPAVQPYCF